MIVTLYTIYERPADYPDHFVVRRWFVAGGKPPTPDGTVLAASTLNSVRALLPHGLFNMGRLPTDDPKIVETWI